MSLDLDTESAIKKRATRVARACSGLPEQEATVLVDEIFRGLYQHFRGERLYFAPSRAARDAAVLREFDGRNKRHVCRRHGISERTLYRILHRRVGGRC